MIQRRIPRPIGTTQRAYQMHLSQSLKDEATYFTFLIKNHINQSLLFPYPTKEEEQQDSGWIKAVNTSSKELKKKRKELKALKAQGKPLAKTRKQIKKLKEEQSISNTQDYTECDIRAISFFDLAKALNMDEVSLEFKVQAILHEMGKELQSQMNPVNLEYLARVAQSRLLKKSLEGLETHSAWAADLRHRTMLAGYKPGMILATNSAMGNETQALKLASDLITKASQYGTQPGNKNITKIGTQNIQNNGLKEGEPERIDGQYITTNQAIKMIEEKGLNPIPSAENGLLQEIGMVNGLMGPDAVPIAAIPSDAQGTMAFNPKDIIQLAHETRRQEELDIVEGQVGDFDFEDGEVEIVMD